MEPLWVKAVIALAPVVICLVAFERFDAFRLVSTGEVAALLAAGAALATGSYFANSGVMDQFPIGFTNYTRFGAPLLEESLKAAFIVLLFAFNPVYRGETIGSYPLVFNAIMNYQHLGHDVTAAK